MDALNLLKERICSCKAYCTAVVISQNLTTFFFLGGGGANEDLRGACVIVNKLFWV